jgi:hypothetical protein
MDGIDYVKITDKTVNVLMINRIKLIIMAIYLLVWK